MTNLVPNEEIERLVGGLRHQRRRSRVARRRGDLVTPDQDAVAAVLAGHRNPGELLYSLDEAWMICGCGERIDVPVRDLRVSPCAAVALFEAHLTTTLLSSEPYTRGAAAVESVARVKALAEEWEQQTDAVAITHQDPARRRAATAGQRRAIASLRVCLPEDTEGLRRG